MNQTNSLPILTQLAERGGPTLAEVQETIERYFPDAGERSTALSLMAHAIELAHEESPGSWMVTFSTRDDFVRLNVGRIAFVSFRPSLVSITMNSPPASLSLPSMRIDHEPFKSLPGATWLDIPADQLAEVFTREVEPLFSEALKRSARLTTVCPYSPYHTTSVVDYLNSATGSTLPQPEWVQPPLVELRSRLLETMRRTYPDWESFSEEVFTREEITYKHEAASLATGLLSKAELARLLAAGDSEEIIARLKRVAQSTNLLYLSTPETGDLSILFSENLDKVEFGHQISDLLHGEGSTPTRLGRYLKWVENSELPNQWTFPTYFLFLCHPESEIFIKPGVATKFLSLIGSDRSIRGAADADTYSHYLEIAGELKKLFATEGARDMIDIQSLIWVCGKVVERQVLLEERRAEVGLLIGEFADTYLASEEGLWHLGMWQSAREEFRDNLEAILGASGSGQDVTARVIQELLPHGKASKKSEPNAWVHWAPIASTNIQASFEASGWVRPEDWPSVAAATLEFFVQCEKDPRQLTEACQRFEAECPAKGFQTGTLTPGLNALHPDQLLIINSKPRLLIEYLTGKKAKTTIAAYPKTNRLGLALVEDLAPLFVENGLEEHLPADLFDMFSHWLVAVRKFDFKSESYWKVAPGEKAWNWDACQEGNFIAIAWDELGDLSGLSKSEFDARLEVLVSQHEDWTVAGGQQAWRFARQIQEGDIVFANQGTKSILGVGRVTGPYYFVEGVAQGHRFPVEWLSSKPLSVGEGSWRTTLIRLDRKKGRELMNRMLDGPPTPPPRGTGFFDSKTFELLASLSRDPVKETYMERREEYSRHVEGPLQELMAAAVERLPEAITDILETKSRVFGRILKNDYGRGGAWPYYWGALYPKGGKRTRDAQLYLSVLENQLEVGFAIGEYGSESFRRFRRNVDRDFAPLSRILAEDLKGHDFQFGPRGEGNEGSSVTEWLRSADSTGTQLSLELSPKFLLDASKEELSSLVAEVFKALFPLVLITILDDPMNKIAEYRGDVDDDGIDPYKHPERPLASIAEDFGFSLEDLRRWVGAIRRKGQAVFYGPPGTGKTFVAEQIAQHLIGEGAGFRDLVQFHPAYAYEDFIQGIRPRTEDGNVTYELANGRFVEFCNRAKLTEDSCVLIVDEINRANLSRVFGELMYLLENRDRRIPLAGGGTFEIPKNVFIIGTMNTADRSIALVDHALRRRFAFLALAPTFSILRHYHESRKTGFDPSGLITQLKAVNQQIQDPHYEVGISFFMREDLKSQIEDIWSMEIAPYLEEYFFDQPEKAREFQWETVKGKVLEG